MVLFVMILGNYLGFSLDFPNISRRDIIPVYTTLYFFLVFTFIVHKIAHIGQNFNVKNPLTVPICILLFYSIATILVYPTAYHIIVWFLLILNMGIYYFIIHVIDDEGFHRRLMWCWVVGGNILTILVMISILVHPQIIFYSKLLNGLDFAFIYAPDVEIRGYAIGHPNHTVLLLNLAFSVILGLYIYETNRAKRMYLLLSLGFCLFANFLTMSKAGIGSLWAMVHFFILFSSKLRKHIFRNVVLFNTIVVMIFVAAYFFTDQLSPRILKTDEKGGYETSLGSRLEIWNAGLTALKQRKLVPFGLGVGGFDLYTEFPHAHSLYFSFFFDFGIVGIICIILIVLIFFREFFLKELRGGMLWSQKTYLETMSLAFLGGLVAIAIHGTVDHTYIKDILWVFWGFAIATLSLSRIEKKKAGDMNAGCDQVALTLREGEKKC